MDSEDDMYVKRVKNEDDQEDSQEPSVTLTDVLNLMEEAEHEADVLFANDNDEMCTYQEGYRRQMLYSCADCMPEDAVAGICLACSLKCHGNHNVYELYTKRHFRCECGNSKFKNKCELFENKSPFNELNKYNQNFKGFYCTCSRPYPDPDEDSEFSSPMLQCCICEDWFHLKHIDESWEQIDTDKFQEMICSTCVDRHSFIQSYSDVNYKEPEEGSTIECKKVWLEKTINIQEADKIALYFEESNWRERLCTCVECKKLYEDQGISFLLDPSDSLRTYYSEAEKCDPETRSTVSSNDGAVIQRVIDYLGPTNAREAFHVFNDMSQTLKRRFAEIVTEGRVCTTEDVRDIFEELQSEAKKRKLE